MAEIVFESCLQALIQVAYTDINGLPGDTLSKVIRIGGISISFISIIYGTYGYTTHKLYTEYRKRDPTVLDYVCCCCCCNYCFGYYHPDVEADDTPEDAPDDNQKEAASML